MQTISTNDVFSVSQLTRRPTWLPIVGFRPSGEIYLEVCGSAVCIVLSNVSCMMGRIPIYSSYVEHHSDITEGTWNNDLIY